MARAGLKARGLASQQDTLKPEPGACFTPNEQTGNAERHCCINVC
jgi:hypothetical protein